MKTDDQDMIHTHVWGPVRRRDFCHYVQIERPCRTCPVVAILMSEPRNFVADPLEIAFADPRCPECRALLRGREPAGWSTLPRENHAQPAERHAG